MKESITKLSLVSQPATWVNLTLQSFSCAGDDYTTTATANAAAAAAATAADPTLTPSTTTTISTTDTYSVCASEAGSPRQNSDGITVLARQMPNKQHQSTEGKTSSCSSKHCDNNS